MRAKRMYRNHHRSRALRWFRYALWATQPPSHRSRWLSSRVAAVSKPPCVLYKLFKCLAEIASSSAIVNLESNSFVLEISFGLMLKLRIPYRPSAFRIGKPYRTIPQALRASSLYTREPLARSASSRAPWNDTERYPKAERSQTTFVTTCPPALPARRTYL